MSTPRVRPADEADMPSIVEIYNDVVRTTTATFEETPRELIEFTTALERKKISGHPWLVAELDGQIVGYATCGAFRPASGYQPTVEHSVHVHAGFRGRGLGSLLLDRLIAEVRAKGWCSMIAGIDASNEGSLRLHERRGFRQVAKIPRVARKFSRWLDLVFMQLRLDE